MQEPAASRAAALCLPQARQRQATGKAADASAGISSFACSLPLPCSLNSMDDACCRSYFFDFIIKAVNLKDQIRSSNRTLCGLDASE